MMRNEGEHERRYTQELGHEVIVANVRELRAISPSDRKSYQVDAEKLARYARLDPNILRPISHRTVEQQEALTLIRARDLLVRLRTAAVNMVRGLTKSCGYRMPVSSTRCFARRSFAVMPPGLQQALGPVLQQIGEMTLKIKQHDRQIQLLTQTEYPETQALLKVQGVGYITALAEVLAAGKGTGSGVASSGRISSLESYLCQGSVTADRLPDAFAIQAVSEVVDAFGAIDRLTIDKSVERSDAAVGCGYGSSVEPTAFRRSDAQIERERQVTTSWINPSGANTQVVSAITIMSGKIGSTAGSTEFYLP